MKKNLLSVVKRKKINLFYFLIKWGQRNRLVGVSVSTRHEEKKNNFK